MKSAPLLLIHGYPFDRTMWFSTIASLGSNARVVAPDLPGFGKNPVPPAAERPSLDYYADFLAKELEQASHEKVVVAGMSMGGYVALAFAERYPDRVIGLGLISSQAAADSPEVKAGRRKGIENIRASGVQVVVDSLGPKMFSEKAGSEIRHYPEEGAKKAGVEGLCWALEAMANRPDRTALLRALECPVLIVHGTEDKIVPFMKARELAEDSQRAIFVEVSGAGHATPLEAPDRVAGGLVQLLQVCRGNSAKTAV